MVQTCAVPSSDRQRAASSREPWEQSEERNENENEVRQRFRGEGRG